MLLGSIYFISSQNSPHETKNFHSLNFSVRHDACIYTETFYLKSHNIITSAIKTCKEIHVDLLI